MTLVKGCFLFLICVAFETGVAGDSTVAPIVTDCKDALGTHACGLLDTSYYCIGEFRTWAIQNCQRTCNLCGQTIKPTISTSTSKPTVSTSTSTQYPTRLTNLADACEVNPGQYVQDGGYWHVGCDLTCKCKSKHYGAGFFACRGRCLGWSSLPSYCSLEDAPPGLCCKQPKCPEDIVITIPRELKDEYPGYKIQDIIG